MSQVRSALQEGREEAVSVGEPGLLDRAHRVAFAHLPKRTTKPTLRDLPDSRIHGPTGAKFDTPRPTEERVRLRDVPSRERDVTFHREDAEGHGPMDNQDLRGGLCEEHEEQNGSSRKTNPRQRRNPHISRRGRDPVSRRRRVDCRRQANDQGRIGE